MTISTIDPPARSTRPSSSDTEPRSKPVNTDLHSALLALRDSGLSNAQLGTRLGYRDGSVVSRYLSRKYDGDVAEVEMRIADLLRRISDSRPDLSSDRFDTKVTTKVANFLNLVASNRKVGVIVGPAGLGKSVGISMWMDSHPTAVMLTADQACSDALGVRRMLWASFEHRGGGNESRWLQIVSHYAGSGRLVVIDQAQRLDSTGVFQAYDFHDRTGVPFVLCGNERILKKVGDDPQNHSRTFQLCEFKSRQTAGIDVAESAANIIAIHCPEHDSADLRDLVAGSIRNPGHLRLAVNTIQAARIYLSHRDCKNDFLKAYRSAHAGSVHGATPLV